MALDQQTLQAVLRYGPTVDSIASQYGISGAALLAKLVQGESGDRGNAVSTAGARGWTQFTPGSRQVAIQKFGIDPWASVDQAVHAASLHLRGKINGSTGLAGYNPGDPSYTSYILGQKVGHLGASPRVPGVSPVSSSGSTSVAGGASSTVPSAPSGQASDFTGLLASLLASNQPQPVQQTPLALPSFAGHAVTPQGFNPIMPAVASASQAQNPLSQRLSLVAALQGPETSQTSGQATTGAQTGSIADRVMNPQTIAGNVSKQRASGFRGSGVFELIHKGGNGGQGFGIKNGQDVNGAQVFSGVWDEHANHVHVAAGPKTIVALGKLAQSMGLHVGENPHFGGVTPVHVPGSYHYKGEAIDVSGSEKLMDQFAQVVEQYNRTHRLSG